RSEELLGEIATWAGPPGVVVVRPSSHKMWVKLQPCNYIVKVFGWPDRRRSGPVWVQHQRAPEPSCGPGGAACRGHRQVARDAAAAATTRAPKRPPSTRPSSRATGPARTRRSSCTASPEGEEVQPQESLSPAQTRKRQPPFRSSAPEHSA